ncbi:hypothetical protein M9Y10_020713 [Tritrichomonas musculus]|uniref:Protein kinase domain-containing protein n=1 Tax=Tritrichomonas musculus TaxID=1915356 RepID=A0ABR2HGP1_9EUKA
MTQTQTTIPETIVYTHENGLKEVYIRHEELGRGKFATVYRVTVQGSSKVYAMKIISKKFASSQGKLFLKDLKNEFIIQKKLNHPNIVRLKEYFSDEINYYVVLEYCPGKSIREYLKRSEKGYLSEPETRKILRDVIRGLVFLHSSNVIHHDLKIENFVIGLKGRVKIADFGLARILENEDDKQFLVAGTTYYLAPEIIQKEPHSYEVDIWAMGVAAFIMLTGKPPFDGIKKENVYEKILDCDFHFPSNINISEEAKNFVTSILKIDPSKRPTAFDLFDHPFLTKIDHEKVELYNPYKMIQQKIQISRQLLSIQKVDEPKPSLPLTKIEPLNLNLLSTQKDDRPKSSRSSNEMEKQTKSHKSSNEEERPKSSRNYKEKDKTTKTLQEKDKLKTLQDKDKHKSLQEKDKLKTLQEIERPKSNQDKDKHKSLQDKDKLKILQDIERPKSSRSSKDKLKSTRSSHEEERPKSARSSHEDEKSKSSRSSQKVDKNELAKIEQLNMKQIEERPKSSQEEEKSKLMRTLPKVEPLNLKQITQKEEKAKSSRTTQEDLKLKTLKASPKDEKPKSSRPSQETKKQKSSRSSQEDGKNKAKKVSQEDGKQTRPTQKVALSETLKSSQKNTKVIQDMERSNSSNSIQKDESKAAKSHKKEKQQKQHIKEKPKSSKSHHKKSGLSDSDDSL